jgi:hypothetical protein
MLNDRSMLKWVLIAVLVLLALPLAAMLIMMVAGAVTAGGMMSSMGAMMPSMGGMMQGRTMQMTGAMMAACIVWGTLVGAALVLLIVLLARGVARM